MKTRTPPKVSGSGVELATATVLVKCSPKMAMMDSAARSPPRNELAETGAILGGEAGMKAREGSKISVSATVFTGGLDGRGFALLIPPTTNTLPSANFVAV